MSTFLINYSGTARNWRSSRYSSPFLGGSVSSPSDPLFSVRAALVLLLAFIVGLVAGVLAYLAKPSIPAAVLVGGGAAGGALLMFNSLIN